MLPLDIICKQSISAKFLWSFGCCEGLARCWVKPDYKYSQERGLRVCWVPFVPILCPSSVSHCCRGGSPGGELLTVGIAVVQERFCARGAPWAQPGRHNQASAGNWDRQRGQTFQKREAAAKGGSGCHCSAPLPTAPAWAARGFLTSHTSLGTRQRGTAKKGQHQLKPDGNSLIYFVNSWW